MVVTSERPLAATLAYVIDDYGEAMMLYGEHFRLFHMCQNVKSARGPVIFPLFGLS